LRLQQPNERYLVSEIKDLRFDGRLADHAALENLRSETDRLVTAFQWKVGLAREFPLIACFMGGTGTGKSTLFNSLAGRTVSPVGIRRPCTLEAVVLVSEEFASQVQDSPYLENQTESTLTVVLHSQPELSRVVLVDTPDFDSVEISNRSVCERFFIISDVVIFVTSQEKYADHSGWEMLAQAIRWGKKTFCVMNKATSDNAYRDFYDNVMQLDRGIRPVRVEKQDKAVEIVPGLRDRQEFAELVLNSEEGAGTGQTRSRELEALLNRAIYSVEKLDDSVSAHAQRIASVNASIDRIVSGVSGEMEKQLDAIVTENIEGQIRERLSTLLRKYDVLFVPRMMVRKALRKIYYSVTELAGLGSGSDLGSDNDKQIRAADFEKTRSAARLEPLQTGIAKLNVQISELLSSDSGLEDLRQVASRDVERWGEEKIQSLYDDAFPGVEHILEVEFSKFRDGLSRSDEMKLYGSYTAWALFLITAEIIVGGGFTLFDAVVNTVIVPFIPKWLLNVKVLDVLREIGERVDLEHRTVLKEILRKQADLYTELFSKLVPGSDQRENLRKLRSRLTSSA
jgi:hypothetical protein